MNKRRRRLRLSPAQGLALTLASILALGALIRWLPGDWSLTTEQKGVMSPAAEPGSTAESDSRVASDAVASSLPSPRTWAAPVVSGAQASRAEQLRVLFEHSLVLMASGRLELALDALDRVLVLAPQLTDAWVNRGFVLYELERHEAALAAFQRALEYDPGQGNAYYGLAQAHEALGDRAAALGAMRAFLHLTPGREDFKKKARAAIWEWTQARSSSDETGRSAPPTAQ